MEYKETLNLPATAFPMKANLAQKELEILEQWEKTSLYEKLVAAGKGKPKYILHDGPPYANGHIHIGHALNKILKDIILKSKRMSGFNAPYVPGWDCHGLPIELQVEKNLGGKKHEVNKLQMRKMCRDYAAKFVAIQGEEFKRLGVLGEWDNPYLTMDFSYEGTITRELARFAGNGGLYKGKKPVHWCSSCGTALAEAEVEYADHRSPSIYVKFTLNDDIGGDLPQLAGKQVHVVIWTTTPWTLPANLAIAIHPELEYVALDTGSEVLIVAQGLLDAFRQATGVSGSVIAAFGADILLQKSCRHPFYDRDSVILPGDHVTLEAGTGCVHTAPGHGQDDYELGLKYGLEIYNPVDNRGRFLPNIEFFAGQFVFDANKSVIDKLQEMGALIFAGEVTHSYPHCWRCKKPIIFRATEQWFIAMSRNDLRAKALEEIERVAWIPKWGKERIYGMIENRPDWCISRQRNWGVPITAFYCKGCGEVLADGRVMHHVADLFEKEGSDIWYEREARMAPAARNGLPQLRQGRIRQGDGHPRRLVRLRCLLCRGNGAPARISARRPTCTWRGATSTAAGSTPLFSPQSAPGAKPHTGASSPTASSWTAQGRKMSKSVGNVVAPEDVIKKYGADVLRLWVAAQDYRDDIRISPEILTRLSEAYRRIRNTCRYILGNLNDFDPAKDSVPFAEMPEIDRWALHQLELLKEKVLAAYEACEFHVLYHAVNSFCTVEMSAFYLDILKDRVYTSRKESPERRSAQTAMYRILEAIVKLIAPLLSFTSDEVWRYMPQQAEESVHLAEFPPLRPEHRDDELVERWDRIIKVRAEVSRALEQARVQKVIGHSLDAAVAIAASPELDAFLRGYATELKSIFIVSKVELVETLSDEFYEAEGIPGMLIRVTAAPGAKCERCWCYDEEIGGDAEHPTICPKCLKAVK